MPQRTLRILSHALLSFAPSLIVGACGDDENASSNSADAAVGVDAAVSETHASDVDAGREACPTLLTACAGKDDVDGVGNLCLRAAASNDEAACMAVSATCLTHCETGSAPGTDAGAPHDQAPTEQQCRDMGDACHEYDEGTGLGQLCHAVGHKANRVQCGVLYDACVQLCGIPDGGAHEHTEDAADAGDAGAVFTLEFAAQIGGEPFACGAEYVGVGTAGSVVTPSDLRFFVSNVRLITNDGNEVPLVLDTVAPFQGQSVALLDFEDGTGDCRNGNDALNTRITGRAPAGQYVGVAFSTSVPGELNHLDPTLQAPPLQPSDMNWSWLLGYKFIKVDLKQVLTDDLDAGADASVPVPGLGVLHLGSTACRNAPLDASADAPVECANPNRNDIVLAPFDVAKNKIVLDLAALFEDSKLDEMAMCHSTGDVCVDLFGNLGLDYASGAATATQTAFRVE